MLLTVVLIFGLIIGSFLNVVILRLGTGESILKGKSRCLNCGKNLNWYELIPVVSFFVQKGRCRFCQSKISLQYSVVELLTGVTFVSVVLKISNFQFLISNVQFFNFNNFLPIIYYWLIFSLLIAISVYDIRHKIIPDKLVYFLIVIALFAPFFNFFLDFGHLDLFRNLKLEIRNLGVGSHILTGIFLFCFFALMWLLSGGKWMGFGDAKLGLAIGFFLGPAKGLLAFLFSFWIGSIFGIVLLVFSRKKTSLKTQIPFAPFLALAAFLAFLIEANFYALAKLFVLY